MCEVIDISPSNLDSSLFFISLVFHMTYFAWMLNKQGDIYSFVVLFLNFESDCCSMSLFNCCFLTCIQISQEAGQVVWYSHLLQNFPQFYELMEVDELISGSSAFSKCSLNIWKFTVHILLKPGLENFEPYFANMWDEGNCAIVSAFFGIVFLWDWKENWPFPVL